MSQQINLLNTALIKRKDFLNAHNIAITLGLFCACLLGYYGYMQQSLQSLSTKRAEAAEKLATVQAALKETTLLHAPRTPSQALQDEIVKLEQKKTMQQQILQTVNQSWATPEKGYAALMRAFAEQRVEGLWLTSFSIDSKSERLNISGRAMAADLIPEYIAHLGSAPALKGKLFSALNINLPQTSPNNQTGNQTNNQVSAQSSNPPASVAASAVASMPADKANAVANAITPKIETPPFIEFALQSIDDQPALKDEKKS